MEFIPQDRRFGHVVGILSPAPPVKRYHCVIMLQSSAIAELLFGKTKDVLRDSLSNEV